MKQFLSILILPLVLIIMAFSQQSSTVASEDVAWYSMEEAQELAQKNGKKVFIYALADWCGYCKKMEQEVYPEQAVINALEEYYYPVKLDIESDKVITFNEDTMTEQQLARTFRITATPTFFFLDDQGEILGKQPGFIPADTFNELLTYVGSDAYVDLEFTEYQKQREDDSEER